MTKSPIFALVISILFAGRLLFSAVTYGATPTATEKKVGGFGIHGAGVLFYNSLGDLGCSVVRIIITYPSWETIETNSGLDFSKMDSVVRTLQSNGIDVAVTIMPNSKRWSRGTLFDQSANALDPTTHADYPTRVDLYKNAITAIVERYDSDGKNDMPGLAYPIDYYQLVNEWDWQWEGTKESYLKFLKVSAQIIKAAHPGAKIILGGITGAGFWALNEGIDQSGVVKLGAMYGLDQPIVVSFETFRQQAPNYADNLIEKDRFILANGTPYFDIIDLHLYTESYQEMIPSVAVIKRYAPDKEIWSLENAGPFYRYSTEKHCQEVAKRYIVGLYHGLKRIFWSSLNPTTGWPKNFLNLSLLNSAGQKKPAYYISKFLATNVGDLGSVEKMDLGSGIEAYKALKGSGQVYVIWTEGNGTSVTLPVQGPITTAQCTYFKMVTGEVYEEKKGIPVRDGTVSVSVSRTPTFVETTVPSGENALRGQRTEASREKKPRRPQGLRRLYDRIRD